MELLTGVRSKAELNTRQFFVDLEIRLVPIDERISYTAANPVENYCLSDGLSIKGCPDRRDGARNRRDTRHRELPPLPRDSKSFGEKVPAGALIGSRCVRLNLS
jgi:hypothetical protein